MSNWLSKSEISLSIANKSQDPTFNNNRVHCYYYSCVQFMFHILHTKKGMDFKTIDDNCNPKVSVTGKGTHRWLNDYFRADLALSTFRFDALDFNNYIGALKKLRIKADYGNDDVDDLELETAANLCNKTHKILSKRY